VSVASQKTRRIVSLAKVKSMGRSSVCVTGLLAFRFVMESSLFVRMFFFFVSLGRTHVSTKKVSLSLLGAELKKM